MRKLLVTAGLIALMLIPTAAKAGWLVEGSLGKGYMVSEPRDWGQLNFMVAPGWSPPVLSLIRVQLGVAAAFADTKGSKTNYELRPMVSICPPILPIFGRAIMAVRNLGGNGDTVYAYGASGGVRFGLGPIGVFGEVAALGNNAKVADATTGTSEKKFLWEIEGRAGAYLEF